MADISTYLQAILDAVYGEDVRGSIHDAIDIINKVGEKNITCGTAVTSQSSSITGYYDGSVYYNTNTYDLWKCDGTQWMLQGNLKGAKGDTGQTGATGTAATIAVGSVTSGATPSVTNSGTSSAAVFDFVLAKGDKGDKGDTGNTGPTGATPDITITASTDGTSSSTPSVVVSAGGTPEEPTFALAFSGLKGAQGIQGETGQTGQAGTDGVSPEVTIATITGGHSVTITDADHPTGQTFNVMDGAAGAQISFSGDAMIIS